MFVIVSKQEMPAVIAGVCHTREGVDWWLANKTTEPHRYCVVEAELLDLDESFPETANPAVGNEEPADEAQDEPKTNGVDEPPAP